MSKNIFNFGIKFCIATVALMLASCEKELDFEYHDIDALPVVEASLSQQGAEVSITLTTPMNAAMNEQRLTDALVVLTDITAGQEYPLTADEQGTYRNNTPGIEGHEYKISETRRGQTYTSSCRMLPATEIKDVNFYWIRMPGDDMAALRILIADNPLAQDYYWIRVYRNGKAYMWDIVNDLAASGGIIEETLTTTHRDETKEEDEKQLLQKGDEVSVIVTPVSREICDYLVALMNGNNGARLYEGGNCLGYFLASPQAKATITYNPDEIDYDTSAK